MVFTVPLTALHFSYVPLLSILSNGISIAMMLLLELVNIWGI